MGKHKILGVGHLPPPVHGASLMTEIIKGEFESYFGQVNWVNLSNSRELKSIGRISLRKISSIFQIYLTTLLQLVSSKFDICYITTTSGGIGFLKDIPIILLSKIRAKRTILHFHNKGFIRYRKESFLGYIFRKVLNGCELWLLSERLIKDVNHLVDPSRIRILPNTILEQAQNDTQSLTEDNYVELLFISNLIKAKGILLLVEAINNIRSITQNLFRLKIVGADVDVSKRELTEKIKALGLEDIVEVIGPVYDHKKYNYLRESDILLLPSYYSKECLPLTLIEGAYFSSALIATKNGAIADIVRDGINGYTVETNDLRSLEQALVTLINNRKLMNTFKVNSKAIYTEYYSNQIFKQNLRNIIYDTSLH